ncbi:MAG: Cof-type HAD-IIB family hydrolase [Rikenellaceae bacterium]
MSYKLLVLDIDGTLTNNNKEITPRTLAALKAVQQRGVKLVLASGRPTYGIVHLAEELEMQRYGGYILSYNGGKIIEVNSGEVIFETTLDRELVPMLYARAVAKGMQILSYVQKDIVCEDIENEYVKYESFLTKMSLRKVESFVSEISFAPDKCLIVGDPEKVIELQRELNEEYGDRMGAYRSEPFYLEAVPLGIDKAKSLERLLEHTGNSVEDMVAVGDGFNDLSMIEYAGLGVAMANAQSEVREAADYVTLSNEEDGVAYVVEKFFA